MILRKTQNQMGCQSLLPDSFTEYFIKRAIATTAKTPQSVFLEAGCGYGVTALKLIDRNVQVCCNDISPEHLEDIRRNVPFDKQRYFSTLPGDISQMKMASGLFNGILCTDVLHFLTGEALLVSLNNFHRWLVDDGFIVITACTPFRKLWQRFIPQFYQNKRDGLRWPGLVSSSQCQSVKAARNLPDFMHFFDIDTLVPILIETGFTVDRISYIDCKKIRPAGVLLDGRENLGVVARKI